MNEKNFDPFDIPVELEESEGLDSESEAIDDTIEEEDRKEDDNRQLTLGCYSEVKELWKEEWQDMPEYINENLEPWKTLYIHFESREDMNTFSKLINQQITFQTRSIWYPKAEIDRYSNKRYEDES